MAQPTYGNPKHLPNKKISHLLKKTALRIPQELFFCYTKDYILLLSSITERLPAAILPLSL